MKIAALGLLAAFLLGASPAGAPRYTIPDAASRLAGVSLLVRAGADRETTGQNGLAALVAETVIRTPVDGVPLADAVAARGGWLTYTVAPRLVRFYVEAPPEALPAAAALVARALAAPAFDAATLGVARKQLDDRIAQDDDNPVAAGLQALRTAYYQGGAGLPPLGTAEGLAGLGPADVAAFYGRYYRRDGAEVVSAGRLGAAADAAAAALTAALPAGLAPGEPPAAARPLAAAPREIVLRRPIGRPFALIGFAAPSLGDADFAGALVVRALLSDVFGRDAATAPPEVRRAVGSIYGYGLAPAQLALWINGARVDPSTAVAAIATVVHGASETALQPDMLARYKAEAAGAWTLEALTLDQRSWEIAQALDAGASPDAVAAVEPAIARVTAADVERIAKRWFSRYDVALVIPRGEGAGG